jgi:hypothetical protein
MNRTERKGARDVVTAAALLGVQHKDEVHYTQQWDLRWQGIESSRKAAQGQFPHHADCSAFVTWCLWQALGDGPDVVNGERWTAGFTGTMVEHGKVIDDNRHAVRGDAVLYGSPTPFHTAIIIGRRDGKLLAASHGEETGPYIVPWDAWQVNSIRRYITSES